MGGPVSAVLLPQELTPAQLKELKEWLDGISYDVTFEPTPDWCLYEWDFHVYDTISIGGSYTGVGEPFGLGILPYSELETGEASHLKAAFGFWPKQELQIVAFCNGRTDHQILGQLTLHLAEKYNGVIDFNGALDPPIDLLPFSFDADYWQRNWSEFELAFEEWMKDMPGKIVGIEYEVGNGRKWVSHKANLEFFRAWLQHPQFRMIK